MTGFDSIIAEVRNSSFRSGGVAAAERELLDRSQRVDPKQSLARHRRPTPRCGD
jgi:hypothetical protein